MHDVLWLLDINARNWKDHEDHFHVSLRTPDRVGLPPNLLADEVALGQTQMVVSDSLRMAAQSLLAEVQPQFGFDQGELSMFVMDVPPDVPPLYAPIVVAEAAQAKDPARTDRSLGVCHLIDNRPEQRLSAINSLGPVGEAWAYFKKREGNIKLEEADYYAAKMTLLQAPEYGELRLHESTQSGRYYPSNSNYVGPDRATVLVEIGKYKVKVLYFFNILPSVGGGTDGYNPHDDKQYCPQGKGRVWRISLNPDDPNAPNKPGSDHSFL